MRPSEGFLRKAMVIRPTAEDLKDHTIKRTDEEGKDVPDHAVLEMKANFTLPEVGDFLNEVLSIELQREEADKQARQSNGEGLKAGPPPEKRFDNRGGGFRGSDSGDGFQRYDNRGPPGGNRGSFQNQGGAVGSRGGGGTTEDVSTTVEVVATTKTAGVTTTAITTPTSKAAITRLLSNSHHHIHHHHSNHRHHHPLARNPPGASSYNKTNNIPGSSANTSTPTVSSYSPPQPVTASRPPTKEATPWAKQPHYLHHRLLQLWELWPLQSCLLYPTTISHCPDLSSARL